MSFWIPARELSITWGDDPRYWKWNRLDSGSKEEVAELLHVCWMDIMGKVDVRSLRNKTTSYSAYLVFKLQDYPTEPKMATASVRFAKEISDESGNEEGYKVFIDHKEAAAAAKSKGRFPHERSDGWMEIKLGEFFNNLGDDGEVQFRLIETDDCKWKSGLVVRGIDIRPN